MENLCYINALRVLQAGEQIKARLSGEFSSVHGLSVSEYFLLTHLAQTPNHRLSRVDLAKRMRISASTVTRMAAPMEKLGLLARESDPRDARLAFVVLTKAGLKRAKEARETFTKQAGYVFRDRWSEKELTELSELLHRLTINTPGELT